MEKYLLDSDGNPRLDEDGKKILNPEWVAANASFTLAADEVDETGTLGVATNFEPTPEAQAWHDEQVAALKANHQKALTQKAKWRERFEEAEAERDQYKEEITTLKSQIERGDITSEEKEGFEAKIREQASKITEQEGQLTSMRVELRTQKFGNRIDSAVSAHILPEWKNVAVRMLQDDIKEDEDGTVQIFDSEGKLRYNDDAEPMDILEYVNGPFRTANPGMFIKDKSKSTNGAQPPGSPPASKGNIFDKKNGWNATHQAMMLKNDPEKAKGLMRAAGYSEQRIAQRMG